MPIILPLLLSMSALQAQPGERTIVVTGERPADYRARLEACLARNCPPDEDIAATLAYAETLFIAGDYSAARQALRESLGRNQRHAAQYPERVADLHHAGGLMSRHLGEDDDARRSMVRSLETLQAGIPQEDQRHFGARLEIADMHSTSGNYRMAMRQLNAVKERASAAGRRDFAAIAELRLLQLDLLLNPRGDAREQIEAAARSSDPDARFLATGAKLMLARLLRREGNAEQADQLIAEVARSRPGGARVLLQQPAYNLVAPDGSETSLSSRNTVAGRGDDHHNTWIDVGFWVMPDGRVRGLEIVRQGAPAEWARPLLQAIRGRVYSAAGDGAPVYRLERYTYTASYELATGSRIPTRSPAVRVEYLDLSESDVTPPSPPV